MTRQEKEIIKQQQLFLKRFPGLVKFPGTDKAAFDCELCNLETSLLMMSVFTYPDFTIKCLCFKCANTEFIRLDYTNKN